MNSTGGWKTKTAAILTGVYAIIGMALHFLGGQGAQGAIDLSVGIPLLLGAFGMYGLRDAIAKVLGTFGTSIPPIPPTTP